VQPDGPGREGSDTRLRHLETITEAALAHLHFDALLDELLGRLIALLDADTAAVLLLEEGTTDLVARAARGLEEEVEAGVRIPVGRGFAGRIAAERRPISIRDVNHADILNPILREKGVESLVGVPLVVEGRVTGVLHVGTLTRRHFTVKDEQLLQLAADRVAVAIDHARLYETERQTAEQLRRLETITEAALSHLALGDLLEALLERVRVALGCDTVAAMRVEGDRLETLAALGTEEWGERGLTVRLGEGFNGLVASEGRPIVVDVTQESEMVTPALRDSGIASLVGVPLAAGGRITGVLSAGSWRRRAFAASDVDLLRRAADRIAVAIENSRLYEAERTARAEAERAAERVRRIESITQVAFHHISIDEKLLEELLVRVRDVLGTDTAAVLEMDDEEQTLVSRAAKGLEEDVERGVRVPLGRGFAGLVAERRETLRFEDASTLELLSPLMREQGIQSLMGVPLLVDDRILGVLHVGSVERRTFTDEDATLLQLAGERLAIAIDHSRLYEREHAVAETLQRSLLPAHLPEVPGAALAARYLPGTPDVQVGGDWYDVIPLPGGKVGLAMGDVVSRGVRAASVMGQLRNSLRAYAIDGRAPASVLERLHGVLRGLERSEMATLVYMVLDPLARTYSMASAGHPPPLVLGADGSVELLEEGRVPPLGAVAETIFVEASGEIAAGSTLLLYTDGLVERRDMWIDEGIERLAIEAGKAARSHPDDLLESLLSALVEPGGGHDDVAALAMTLTPLARELLSLQLPAEPGVLSSLRRTLRQWLEGLGAGEEDIYDVLVAVTEAAANAVEHAYGPVDATFSIEARALPDQEMEVVVRDSGRWRPPRGHNRGRGTLLMQELMDHFEVVTSEAGTEVRMRRSLGHARAGACA
jgi:GAF domain-containing protein/anti-sigma regulatory factor (Ser/Thr protein kinase)